VTEVVAVAVLLHVPVPVAEGVAEGVALLEKDTLPVLLADEPILRDAVREAARVELAEGVGEGVGEGVPVPVGVLVPEPVSLGV